MMLRIGKGIQIKLADSEEDYEMVYQVRKAVFGKEQGYLEKCLILNRRENQYYILCLQDNKPVGTVTAELSEKPGYLDIDKHYDLIQYYHKYGRLIFWSRIAVLREYRNSLISSLLYMFMHKLTTKLESGYIIVDCKMDNEISKNLLPKLGFKRIDTCVKGEIGPVIVWGATPNDYTKIFCSYVEQKGISELFRKYFDLSQNQNFSLVLQA